MCCHGPGAHSGRDQAYVCAKPMSGAGPVLLQAIWGHIHMYRLQSSLNSPRQLSRHDMNTFRRRRRSGSDE